MPDPFLFELMHSLVAPSKLEVSDPLNEAFENAIKAEVAALREQYQDSGLLSEDALLRKIEADVRKDADLTEFEEHLQHAIAIFRNEGQSYLEKEPSEQLNLALDEISVKIRALDLKSFTEEALLNALSIPGTVAASILKIGSEKFTQGLLTDSLDVFRFLTLVCADEPEFWYRLGLVAHKDGQHELAIKAFKTAEALDDDFIEPHIFTTECHIDLKEYDEARQELNEAKQRLINLNQSWAESIALLESLIDQEAV